MAIIQATGPTTNGTEQDDIINGRPESDFIDARGGNDIVLGLGGADTMFGRDGNDILFGFDGVDIIFGEANNDILNGFASDDVLDGGSGNDLMLGGPGSDRLIGRTGSDDLFGEGDADSFVYNFVARPAPNFDSFLGNPAQGNDTVRDFQAGVDAIRMFGITENLDTDGNGLLNDEDTRVDGTRLGNLIIDLNGVALDGGATASGTVTVIGVTELSIGTDIIFTV